MKKQTSKRKTGQTRKQRKDAANIVKAIGLARILTAYEEANRRLPETILSEFRAAVGLPAEELKPGSPASWQRFEKIRKIPSGKRHWLFYEFWEEYFDFKLDMPDFYDESPDWLKAIADEIMGEMTAEL